MHDDMMPSAMIHMSYMWWWLLRWSELENACMCMSSSMMMMRAWEYMSRLWWWWRELESTLYGLWWWWWWSELERIHMCRRLWWTMMIRDWKYIYDDDDDDGMCWTRLIKSEFVEMMHHSCMYVWFRSYNIWLF